MSRLLYRLGHYSVRHRRWMLGFWLVVLIGVAVAGNAAGGKTSDKFSIPGTESQKAFDLLASRFPAQSGSTEQIVFAAPAGQ
jgi:putative drug exporter of the RND superfamily